MSPSSRTLSRALSVVAVLAALCAPAAALAGRTTPPVADAAQAERLERLEHALDTVDATDAQRDGVHAIVADTWPRLSALRAEAGELRERMRGLFLEDEIDRDAVEATRMDLVELFDRATSVAVEAWLDAAELFTPAQRATLQELRAHRLASRWGAEPR